MKPVLPVAKRLNGFSIDSIMSKDGPKKSPQSASSKDDSEPGETSRVHFTSDGGLGGRLPPLHPSLPQHVRSLLLNENPASAHPDVMALRTAAWAFTNTNFGPVPNFGPGMSHPVTQHIHPGLLTAAQRDPTHMYPWLLSRHGAGLFNLPYGGHTEAGLLFHPYRKPKRIRTAFSPSQLLKLEHCFEKNHYVVGQERKDLALKLGLTETQVKVWFQNRRTKYKRMKAEEDGTPMLCGQDDNSDSISDDEMEEPDVTSDFEHHQHEQTKTT